MGTENCARERNREFEMRMEGRQGVKKGNDRNKREA